MLAAHVGTAARARLVITGTPRRGEYEVRVAATAVEWAAARIREPVLLKLPKGRAPPQGAVVELVGELREPRRGAPFDEWTWLRRHGVHVVVRAAEWEVVGRRGGILGFADRIRARVAGSIAPGLHGDRRALLQGIVLGDDGDLSQRVRDSFRASGLYHLLAVSGQNVALVAAGALELSWLVGIGRLGGEVGALAAIVAYVLAVGAQPSVVRAGIAGALGSLAWLTARTRDRWYFLLFAAVALLAWNPYTLLDPGLQLSFAAVAAIFVLAPRIKRRLDGYPLAPALRVVVAISSACALATAPISWLHFHSLALLTLVANVLAAPAVAPLLALGLAAAVVTPVSAGAAAAIAWLNGWCAAYVIACATFIGGLPGAQIRSTRALLVVVAGALLVAAYALPRWQRSSSPST
jgi:competence protein ComEC